MSGAGRTTLTVAIFGALFLFASPIGSAHFSARVSTPGGAATRSPFWEVVREAIQTLKLLIRHTPFMAEVSGANEIKLSDTTEQESDKIDFNFSPRGKCHVCGGYENGRFKIPKCKSTRRAMIVQLNLPKRFEEALINRNNVQLCSLHFPKSAFMIVKGKKILYDRRKVLPYKMPKWSEIRSESNNSQSKPVETSNEEIDQDMFSFATNYSCVICDKRRPINEMKVLPIKAKPRLDNLVQLGMPDYYFWEIMIAPNPLICYSHIPKDAPTKERSV